jgi:hypothetical protein
MCCFSPVQPAWWLSRLFGPRSVHVSDTSIFARPDGPETQILVYSMKLSVGADVAMILPLPTPAAAAEDAVSFVDLHEHASFFEQLAWLFEPPLAAQAPRSAGPSLAPKSRYLKVHRVGSFVASFVPSRSDFGRLEPRFRLPDTVWDAVPDARDYGFAVFQLEAGNQHVHPMAFRFRTRDAQRLFFPTVHVHDGRVHATAKFDHTLYYQHPRGTPANLDGAEVSFMTPSSDYAGIVRKHASVLRRTLRGSLPNRDTWVDLG